MLAVPWEGGFWGFGAAMVTEAVDEGEDDSLCEEAHGLVELGCG